MKEYILPIVGASFRPPAQEILAALSVGAQLELEAEPDNPHDPNAIAVWIWVEDIPSKTLASLDDGRLKKHNMIITDLTNRRAWHLGYIPAKIAAVLRQDRDFPENRSVSGSFAVGKNGSPQVRFHLETEEQTP